MHYPELPVPSFFDPQKVGQIWRVPYQTRAAEAADWAREHRLLPASQDQHRIWLLMIDVQITFCVPGGELYVAGRNGNAAVEDSVRLCEFIYRNLGSLTHLSVTMDTHQAMQIFHPIFFVDKAGNHPAPYMDLHAEALKSGKWHFNPALAPDFDITPEYGQQMMIHYAETLEAHGKFALTIWPYHAMLGGIGHALVPALEEAIFFHSMARLSQPKFDIKGDQPFTENYSAIGPEVQQGPQGEILGARNPEFIQQLQSVDALIVSGQAKSHCLAWTVADLLADIRTTDPSLARKVYLLEDTTSAIVVPGVVDHTQAADKTFQHFAEAGMHRVKSTTPLSAWPDFPQ